MRASFADWKRNKIAGAALQRSVAHAHARRAFDDVEELFGADVPMQRTERLARRNFREAVAELARADEQSDLAVRRCVLRGRFVLDVRELVGVDAVDLAAGALIQ